MSGISAGVTKVFTDPVTGVIDGVNRIFTVPNFIASPIFLSLANSNYEAGVDYTVTGGTQITMAIAPDLSLANQPFWFVHN